MSHLLNSYQKRRVHNEGPQLICDFCGKVCYMKIDLKDHIKTHMSTESRRKFPCASCGALLLSLQALQHHEQAFHSNIVGEHPCECGEVFATKAKLYQHRTNVHSDTYPCSFCYRVFRSENTLMKHNTKVHGKKIPCNVSLSIVEIILSLLISLL